MKQIIAFLLTISLGSCVHWEYTVTDTKIAVTRDRIHLQKLGKPRPLKDTIIYGYLIEKHRSWKKVKR